MVSRRRILSKSRENLDSDLPLHAPDEDIWFQRDKLYRDHIQEVLEKWEQIDDEIWAKVIVMERNRRVAKAYARAPVLTINGSDEGFDGFRLGLSGFLNPGRDPKTEEVKRRIGAGIKLKMDPEGSILVKRSSKSNVYVKNTLEETSLSNDILKLPNAALPYETPEKLFDMHKFEENMDRELKRAYPDRKKLEWQCVTALAFLRNEEELLDSPCWILILNIVALDLLKSRLPLPRRRSPGVQDKIVREDEDPYSLSSGSGSGSSGISSRDSKRPAKKEHENGGGVGMLKNLKSSRGRDQSKKDDPYYCGLRAKASNSPRGGNPNAFKEGLSGRKGGGGTRGNNHNNNNNNNNSIIPAHTPFFPLNHARSMEANLCQLGFYPQKGEMKLIGDLHARAMTKNNSNKLHHSRTLPQIINERESEWENYWDS